MTRRYKAVAIGGTFDLLHRGHRQLIATAFEIGDLVLIGVSGDRLVTKLRKNHTVEPYASRLRELRSFIKTRGWSGRASIARLQDPFGPALRDKNLGAIVVSKETLSSALELNRLRRRRGLNPLVVRKVKLVRAQDGKPISTTRIRSGEIDREGRLLGRR